MHISRGCAALGLARYACEMLILSLFHVIALILFISGRGWEADFVAIYGDRAHYGKHMCQLDLVSSSHYIA